VVDSKQELDHIGALVADPENRRKHTPRNVGLIVDALHKVGAARSIVIDENNEVLAGNATVEAAGEAGITKLRVVDASGDEVVAVRRTGLTSDQKRELAIYDNRTSELAEWDVDQLLKDVEAGVDLSAVFMEDELSALLEQSSDVDVAVPERVGDVDDSYVDFRCGDLSGKISRSVYDSFVTAYRSRQESSDAVVLDDVLQAWLGLA
jgi:hypothetical protein